MIKWSHERVPTLTDRIGNTWTNAYDVNDNQVVSTDPFGNSILRTYDAAGQMTARTDRSGNTTAYAYDALNRLTVTTDPLLNADARVYDANGNLLSYADRSGKMITPVAEIVLR